MFVETKDVLGTDSKSLDIDKKVWQEASSELSEYIGKPIRDISIEFWQNKHDFDVAAEDLLEGNAVKEKLDAYYKNTRKYLYECTCWESYKSKQRDFKKILLFLRKMNIDNVLDFGGGTGSLLIYLAKRGLRCSYLDVEGETLEFARWRFRKNNLNVEIKKDIKNCPADFYNAVISDNVFEHLFDLEGAITDINRVLRIGGFLVARSSFGGGGPHLRKNDIYSSFETYDELISAGSFYYRGQLKDDFLTREIDKHIKNYWIFGISLKNRRKSSGNFLVHQKLYKKEA